ncbi:hypothetical protein A1O1_04773 [Capronia coronata CBS 617.96]|uniref:Pseudouridine synthase I TruA alpha/beta domain-containing protein n=1 Tax=Capronia coronata CBS 617.96 TaxID=1182541 RepID=W9YF42_9EURO|nr:uncharacterized protein A1O1_04773 [Capronia coronata CBS 617.96]EXJ87846.1 hypothetical protein A1O1_04773 [Capronia coronata CBS 617.96]
MSENAQYKDHGSKKNIYDKRHPAEEEEYPSHDMGAESTSPAADYTTYSTADLIDRISALERQLREQTARIAALGVESTGGDTDGKRSITASSEPSSQLRTGTHSSLAPPRSRSQSPSRRARPFDPTLYATRHIALKFAYLGGRYNGYEHANGNVLPMPTVEEVLWKALRKTRLISPSVPEGADQSMDVVWEKQRRLARYTDGKSGGRDEAKGKVRLDLNWDGCQYSKCGRTDRGVSAFGQVIGLRVRSNRPIEKEQKQKQEGEEEDTEGQKNTAQQEDGGKGGGDGRMSTSVDQSAIDGNLEPTMVSVEAGTSFDSDDQMPSIDTDDLEAEPYSKPFDPIKDELSYVTMLNAILPPDIRILAWCPDPPANFDARFSCRERRYKYFFTNPAFCPTPGPRGMRYADGRPGKRREGWLDIEKMRQAAKKLEGLHDFRNLCKIDASKQMPSCERRITYADVVECDQTGKIFSLHPGLNESGAAVESNNIDSKSILENGVAVNNSGLLNGDARPSASSLVGGPRVYTFCVNGSAFLWHQVRCMVAVLFLVGQGLEEPSIIDELLDVDKNPGRPMYEMADDAPLVLWDCIFPDTDADTDKGDNSRADPLLTDSLNWIYAGDQAGLAALPGKNDGKFGSNGVVEEVWSQWRQAKIHEVLAGSLLDLTIGQGDGSALQRSIQRDGEYASHRRQKVFDGGNSARLAGRYVSVMKKPRMDSLHVQNTRWLNGRKLKRDAALARDQAQAQVEDQVEGQVEGQTQASRGDQA